MRILVTFAVASEFAPWRGLRNLETRSVDGNDVFQAQIGRAKVDFVVTGMGVERATEVTKAVLSKEHDFCIAAGFAGALTSDHRIGDVLVAEAVQFLGKAKTLQCGTGLVKNASEDGATRVKLLLTSDHVIRTPHEKAALAPFADFVDMESFGVLEAAQQIARPAVAIRVISDKFDGEIPADVELTMSKKGQIEIGRALRYLAIYPSRLPALIRLGRDSSNAAQALAAFLEAHIQKISFFTHGWYPDGGNLERVAAR